MELIESTFSGASDQTQNDEQAHKRAAVKILHNVEDQAEAIKEPEHQKDTEKANKEAHPGPANKPEQEKKGAGGQSGHLSGSSSEDDDDDETPRRLPAVKIKQAPEMSFKPPMQPHKNVIPARRTPLNNDKILTNVKREPPPTDLSPGTSLEKSSTAVAVSDKTSSPTTSQSSGQREILPDATSLPTRIDLPVASAASPVQQQLADLPTRTDLPSINADALTTQSASSPILSAHPSATEGTRREAESELAQQERHVLAVATQSRSEEQRDQQRAISSMTTMATPIPIQESSFLDAPTTPLPILAPIKPLEYPKDPLTRKKALLAVALLAMLLVNALAASFDQSFGAQGWASVWNNQNTPNQNLLTQIARQLQHSPTPGNGKATTTPAVNPTQIVNLLMSNMTLGEKLGQMMMVQFTGPDYSPQLEAMISQYQVGSVLVFAANGNIVSKPQLKGLLAQMQKNAFLPLAISIDQEGGTVDRLIKLDGAQPAAATIGASGDPQKAYDQGVKDAQDLASYGFNLNLAPVVDVTNVYNDQLYDRTYGDTPALVTSMAGAYLQGLQKSGKVLGTLKHFPGLGDVSVDPHYRPPDITRSLADLNAIDWAPYTNLIKQGNVYAVMVTHEYVSALDTTEPSSLSPKVIGILRQQMHFQGVIMTDSLTMDSISNYYSPGQAAAMAVEAGDDLLMGAQSPNELAAMLQGIKQAMASGAISQQHIDDSVRRILLLKYQMGLIHI